MQATWRSLTPLILWLTARYALVSFLFAFVVWTVLSAVLNAADLDYGSSENFQDLLDNAFVWASFMAAIFGGVAFLDYRKLFDPAFDKPFSVVRSQYIALPISYPEAFEHCLATIPSLETTYVLLENRAEGRIEAAVLPRKLWQIFSSSLGERVTIRMGSDTEGETKILIESKAVTSRASFGPGRHKRNVEQVVQHLQSVGIGGTTLGEVPAA